MINPRNILIVRTDRIGDVVLSLPMAELIKKHYPGCKITFLLRNYTESLAADHPYIDEILLIKQNNGEVSVNENIKLIKEKKFDTSILVYPTFKSALILFLSGIQNRIGTGYRWYSFLFNNKIYEHRKYAEKHELEFNVNLLTKLGIKEEINKKNVSFNLQVNKQAEKKVDKILKERGIIPAAKPLIIIHPGSGGSAIDLPIPKFSRLVSKIGSGLNSLIVITGSREEYDICSEAAADKAYNLAGLFNLSELTALISKADLFISNSTGPIHIAAALGIPTIGFYPKILSCSAERWGPYSEKSRVFKPKIDCSNCTREQCERLNCMNSIEVDEIFDTIKKIVK